VEILAGNIGYLDLRFFANPTYGGTTATAAMAVLANTDAIIIDLRQNGGGEPGMVQLLCSYFFEPEPVLINSLYWRKSETTQQFWTLPYLPGMRLPTTPVYVLISPRTGSAAEEFAYNLQTQNRATLLGQKTVGAANPGDGFKLVHGFEMFISTGAAVNPITKTNWEGQGVQPDLEVPAEEALVVAQMTALQRLLDDAGDPQQQRELTWALQALEAKHRPMPLDGLVLADYVGNYETRQIRLETGRLTYQRGNRSRQMMLPIDKDLFVLEGVDGFQSRFERDEAGRIVRLVDMWSDGHQESNRRG
jgi:C-terminal processing protease CtpA/Prc